MNKFIDKFLTLLVFVYLVIDFSFLSPFFLSVNRQKSVSFAQTLSPESVSEAVYEQMPTLPKENNYLREETGEKATNNDLISRMVRYHQYVKARPTRFRLDWKLTLADYLGKNEQMREDQYPGYSTLQQNPFKKDREIIGNLTMEERQQLVEILVSIFSQSLPQTFDNKSPEGESPSESTPVEDEKEDRFRLPRQGGAELLLP